jgi:hypothetical protein
MIYRLRASTAATSRFSPKYIPVNVIKISPLCCPSNTKLSPNAQLLSSAASSQLFTSQRFTFFPAYLYRKDERAVPGNLQNSKLSLFPFLVIIYNLVPYTTPLLHLYFFCLLFLGGLDSIPRFVVDIMALEQFFLSVFLFFPVSVTPQMFDTHLHINIALNRRTKGRCVETLKAELFRISRSIRRKSISTMLLCLKSLRVKAGG